MLATRRWLLDGVNERRDPPVPFALHHGKDVHPAVGPLVTTVKVLRYPYLDDLVLHAGGRVEAPFR